MSGRVLLAFGLLTASVAAAVVAAAPHGRVPRGRGTPVTIHAAAVPLNPEDPSQTAVGPFTYAGGVVLTSTQTDQLHGLSDIEITGLDRMTVVTDDGMLVTARLVLDNAGRLTGVNDARLEPLTGRDGKPLGRPEVADSEGLAVLRNGDRLVSFERQHRIWLYPARGGSPRPVPHPESAPFRPMAAWRRCRPIPMPDAMPTSSGPS